MRFLRFGSGPRRVPAAFALASSLLLLPALLALGCGGGSGGGSAAPPPDDGATAMLRVHQFEWDPEAKAYLVQGESVRQAEVDRDLAGSLCSRCHPDAVGEIRDSVHYRIAARTDRVLFPGGGAHGMLDRACGLPATTGLTNYLSDPNLGECAKCHVGRYLPVMEGFFAGMFGPMGVADPQGEAAHLVDAGLDCLICHSGNYRSHPEDGNLARVAGTASADGRSPTPTGSARDARDNSDFDHDGAPDPMIDVDGDGTPDVPLMMDTNGDGQPDTPWPTVAQDRSLEALTSIGPTTEEKCLRCHEHARTGYKRGTLFLEGHDVHAAAAAGPFVGAENRCTVCHTADHHKFVRGHRVGGDLAAADYPAPAPGVAPDPADPKDLTCEKCHPVDSLPKGSLHSEEHLAVMACETCHIPWSSGINYSLFGHGGQLSFSRDANGHDSKLVNADMYVSGDRADIEADWTAYRARPILMWFDGGTSFLAQSLSARYAPNAKITPFKPMGNGMVFDARFFSGETATNDAGATFNAYSMYRFFANGSNAEAFAALGMLDMSPDDVRHLTMAAFLDTDPDVQTMALMLVFPNLIYFDKANFGYEHYLTKTGSAYDANGDGIVDAGSDFLFDMLAAANAGLRQFTGFNGPMGFPANYEWYPFFTDPSQPISMKLPDGSFMKMFLRMRAATLPANEVSRWMQVVDKYPAFSQVTLGGHGVVPKEEALGGGSRCTDCHGADGVLAHPVPVTRKEPTDLGPMGVQDLPVYRWRYYRVKALVDLGLATSSEDVLAGRASVVVEGKPEYVRDGGAEFVLNFFAPAAPGGYRGADDATALEGTGLVPGDLSWRGGDWMPVLEPVTDDVPNYEVLGFSRDEVIWD